MWKCGNGCCLCGIHPFENFKVSGPRVQTFCIEKDSHNYGNHLTCKHLKMMLFYSKTKKIKYFLDPPPKKKRRRDTNGRDMAS